MPEATPSPLGKSPGFAATLGEERAALTRFVALLQSEQEALISQDADRLLQLVEEKNRFASQLNDLESARTSAMHADKTTDFETWLSRHDPASLSVWTDIRRLATEARRLNQTNGELIQIKLRYNQQALSVLFGAAENAAGLYGRDGQASILPSSGRPLGSV